MTRDITERELKVKKILQKNGFLKIEKLITGEDRFILFKYIPLNKIKKWKEISRFTDEWDFRVLCRRLEEDEYIEKLKIIKTYPKLKEFFWDSTKSFIRKWKRLMDFRRGDKAMRRGAGSFTGGLSGEYRSCGGWDEAEITTEKEFKIYKPIPIFPNLNFMEKVL